MTDQTEYEDRRFWVIEPYETMKRSVGITDYYLDKKSPVYFDLYGNQVEKKSGIILIEQSGLKRKKVWFD